MDQISNGKDEHEILANKLVIEDLIKGLNKGDKEIIVLRYYREKTQAQVAKILGITQVQVSRLEKKILALMKEKLIS
ncbi:RNA polymerase sigma-F factor [compost metagenome]